VKVLAEHGDDLLACLLPALKAAGPGSGPSFDELAADCERRLAAITVRSARADDDWSVPWSGGCGCELCGRLGGFLADRGELSANRVRVAPAVRFRGPPSPECPAGLHARRSRSAICRYN
jgi:hypothetical protein